MMLKGHVGHTELVYCVMTFITTQIFCLLNTIIRVSFFSNNSVHFCYLHFFYVLGHINEDRLRDLLTTMGERFTDDEVCSFSIHTRNPEIIKPVHVSQFNNINYMQFHS